jgi:hypothetical protein
MAGCAHQAKMFYLQHSLKETLDKFRPVTSLCKQILRNFYLFNIVQQDAFIEEYVSLIVYIRLFNLFYYFF